MEELQIHGGVRKARQVFSAIDFRTMEQRSRRGEMNQKTNLSSSIGYATFMSTIALALILCGASAGGVFAAAADSLDQLYEKAKKEGKITDRKSTRLNSSH